MSIGKDISELLEAKVISQETGDRIREYYRNKPSGSPGRLLAVFGILGAILVGLGLILIIAHNWDEMSKAAKTFFAFLPLVTAQALCAYALLKKQGHRTWRESTAGLLFFSVGATISLISQIYHIPGDLAGFLLTWMLLVLPLSYIMKSGTASLLYVAGITYYAVEAGYWSYPATSPFLYWVLFLLALPYYYRLNQKMPRGNFTVFHHWFIPLSLTIVLGSFADEARDLMYIAYMSLFGLFYALGNSGLVATKNKKNGYSFIGETGTIVLLLILSYDWFWLHLETRSLPFPGTLVTPEFIAASLFTLAAAGLLYQQRKRRTLQSLKISDFTFLLFIIFFLLGLAFAAPAIAGVNLLILFTGISYVRWGVKYDLTGSLNYGFLIITALIICRFFDTNISFILRGILFVSLGISFFLVNYWLLKKRKIHE